MIATETLIQALNHNAFPAFLRGEKEYVVKGRDSYGDGTDAAVALYAVYKYFVSKPDSRINALLETTLIDLLKGNMHDILTAFSYFTIQFLEEMNETAPFYFKNESYRLLQKTIKDNAETLREYKAEEQYGKTLNEGAYEYMTRLGAYLNTQYGRKSS